MTVVSVDIPPNVMKQIELMKIDKKTGSKANAIVTALEDYFSQNRFSLIQEWIWLLMYIIENYDLRMMVIFAE